MRRRTTQVLLLLLGLVLGQVLLAGTEVINGEYWYFVSASQTQLTSDQSEEAPVTSLLYCAAYATSRPWADLFCYSQGQCLAYRVVMNGVGAVPPPVPSCWTIYPPETCRFPFVPVTGVGCLYYHPVAMSWSASQDLCKGVGGDLIIPDDYSAFLAWADGLGLYDTWVGANGAFWLDGTSVQRAGLDQTQCLRFKSGPTVGDKPCGDPYPCFCEMTVP